MGQLIDATVPYDTNMVSTTAEKITKYHALELRLKKMFGLRRISTVPIVVSSNTHLDMIQKTAVLGTVYILQHVLMDNIGC
eukprot:8539179-Ditylum_brightwellii.AAC.1